MNSAGGTRRSQPCLVSAAAAFHRMKTSAAAVAHHWMNNAAECSAKLFVESIAAAAKPSSQMQPLKVGSIQERAAANFSMRESSSPDSARIDACCLETQGRSHKNRQCYSV